MRCGIRFDVRVLFIIGSADGTRHMWPEQILRRNQNKPEMSEENDDECPRTFQLLLLVLSLPVNACVEFMKLCYCKDERGSNERLT
jgi:hypothetical protein